jgi:hypothetical protein
MMVSANAVAESRQLYELFKVDLSCPTEASTFKEGWTWWRIPGGCDGDGQGSAVFWNIDDTRIDATLTTLGDTGLGNLRAGPGEPIANTTYSHARGRQMALSLQLTLSGDGLVPGEYLLRSYHNDNRDRSKQARFICAITATGPGVTQFEPVYNVPIQKEQSDEKLAPSEIRFRTAGDGPVTIAYIAREQANAVLNAFCLYSLQPLVIASEAYPANGAKDVPPNTQLRWKPGAGAGAHDLYMDVDKDEVQEADRTAGDFRGTLQAANFEPSELRLGHTYYWRVDEISKRDPNVVLKGKTWTFTVVDGKAHQPYPLDTAIDVLVDVTLKWKPGYEATAHKVYFGTSWVDVSEYAEPVYVGEAAQFSPGRIEKVKTYYWRVDEVRGEKVVTGDVWQFLTEGALVLQVDLAVPQWGSGEPMTETAKPGWTIWAARAWADLYSHDIQKLENAGGTNIDIWLTLGNEGMGCLKAKGLRMYSMAGDGPPSGKVIGEPLCNTWYESADWASYAGRSSEWGNILVVFGDLPAGEYELYSYHNHFYHCDRYEDSCLGIIKYRGRFNQSAAEQGPMPAIRVQALPPEALPGYDHWSLPKGTGKGVTAVQDALNVTAQHVDEDRKLSASLVKFHTDGSAVLVVYEAPRDYWDYREYPGGRAILNAFRLIRVKP